MTGREDSDEPDPPPPDSTAVSQFEAGASDAGPTLDNFVIDVAASAASKWNKKIIKIFVKHFIQSSNNEWTLAHKKIIESKMKERVKYMHKKFTRELEQISNAIPAKLRLRIAARRRRRLQVSQ
ncbi:MAG TPA: hypothetical protein VGO47_12980 [Chlamydiales bacterium]|jgi:hypothetical protein|nr:hypothetical protein [Chlamydiales bacterium]